MTSLAAFWPSNFSSREETLLQVEAATSTTDRIAWREERMATGSRTHENGTSSR